MQSDVMKCHNPLTLLTAQLCPLCSVSGNSIGPTGAEALGKALETNSTLQALQYAASHALPYCQGPMTPLTAPRLCSLRSVAKNEIGPVGAEALGKALETNSTLQALKYAASHALPTVKAP